MADTLKALEAIFKEFLPQDQAVDGALQLIGESRIFESMTLVEMCLALEDKASEEGFVFDWTSEHALSRSRSIFRTLATLADEYARQKAESL